MTILKCGYIKYDSKLSKYLYSDEYKYMASFFLPFITEAICNPIWRVVGPIFATINPINPLNWIVYLSLLFGLYYGPSEGSFLNSVNGKKSWGRTALSAFIIYLIVMLIFYFILIWGFCSSGAKEIVQARYSAPTNEIELLDLLSQKKV